MSRVFTPNFFCKTNPSGPPIDFLNSFHALLRFCEGFLIESSNFLLIHIQPGFHIWSRFRGDICMRKKLREVNNLLLNNQVIIKIFLVSVKKSHIIQFSLAIFVKISENLLVSGLLVVKELA